MCDQCQKRNYRTRKAAKIVTRRFPGEHMVAYRCPYTKRFWHTGHLPTPVIRGIVTKDEIYKGRTAA